MGPPGRRMQQPHWRDGQSKQRRQSILHLASSSCPHAIALQASIHTASKRFWPGEINYAPIVVLSGSQFGNSLVYYRLRWELYRRGGGMRSRKGCNENCWTRQA
jgi:hypothetical protein